jgi:hypothetical protein
MTTLSGNELYRTLIAFGVLSMVGVGESKMIPWGLGDTVIVPLGITYGLLGFSIGTFHPENIKKAIANGMLAGLVIYSIVFSWLFEIGFFTGDLMSGVGKYVIGIVGMVIASIVTQQISLLLKISEDEKK